VTKWKLMPVEPTQEMLRAGATRYTAYRVDAGSAMFYAYAAMLEAAPQPPKSEPIAYIEHHKGGDNLVWDNPGGEYSALYSAPPAPSVHVSPMENIALDEWLDKTEWVQKEINTFPVSSLGMHRADVMRIEIERLREMLAAPPAPSVPDCLPVAWLHIPHDHLKDRVRPLASTVKYSEPAVYAEILPCYAIPTAPQPTKLIDERINQLACAALNSEGGFVAFARAIEREILGEKA